MQEKLFRFYSDKLGEQFVFHMTQEEITLLLNYKQGKQVEANLSNGGLAVALRLSRDIETLLLTLQDTDLLDEYVDRPAVRTPAKRPAKKSGRPAAAKAGSGK